MKLDQGCACKSEQGLSCASCRPLLPQPHSLRYQQGWPHAEGKTKLERGEACLNNKLNSL